MNNFAQFLLDSKNSLTYSNEEQYVNTDKFNVTDKFNEIYHNAIQEIQNRYSLPAFHIWETGYCQGDASDEQIFESISKINSDNGDGFISCDIDLYNFLDNELIDEMQENVDDLIHEFNDFVNNEIGSIIVLNTFDVRNLLKKELLNAYKFDWTGWRIPIYLDGADDLDAGREIECKLSSGSWISNNSWQPDAIEVYKIQRWELQYDLTNELNEDEEVEFSIDDMLDNYDWQEEIENNILEHFNHRFEPKFEVDVKWN